MSNNIMAARTKKSTATTTAVDPFQAFLSDLADLIAKHQGASSGLDEFKTTKPEPEDEPDEDEVIADTDEDEEDEPQGGGFDEAELQAMKLPALRKLAIAEGFAADEVNEASKEDIIESLLEDDGEEPDDEDEDDDDDADEDEREELMALTAAALRKKARDEHGATANEVKGLDKESLVDLILNADDDDDTPDDDDDADDDEDEAGDEYTAEDVAAMSADEIKEQLDEWEVEYPARASVKALRALLLSSQYEEE